MRLGYFTMPLHPPGADPALTMEADLQQLVVLEGLGFEEAWIGEHFTAVWENIPCPDLFIAKALGMTRTLTLATGVSCLPNHHPLMLAQRIAQLDQLARGRFYWGVGSGGFPGDFELFGINPQAGEHREVTRAALELILQLWTDPKPGLYESKYWRFRVPDPQEDIGLWLHLRPYQRPHPPIAVAGVSADSETLVLAGERGYLPMSINFVPARILRTHWAGVETGARRAGRPADRASWRVARDIYVADTTARARREALAGPLARDWKGYFLPLLAKTKRLGLLKVDPEMPDAEVTIEYLLDHIWIVGDPDTVAVKLAALRADVGGFGRLLVIGHEWEPHEAWVHSMTLLTEQVAPRLTG
ncbi:MAG TPA: LLM class flavin-dependent oxidoreductase [Methylomirabilota bacterium]|jgi:alkanesulfonate monooxygenase SsuD/methylene tetrahydromethanopterin reductase-like flavin-dependent oxidoreductase (luciferase family)|nr:LLM class flavin-dependent oxidoreductase [Methylomirabilota bacterium]